MGEIKGLVFDIKQFAIFDGPGIRTTVFLKGCPLRCQWCHNPEGLSFYPQRRISNRTCATYSDPEGVAGIYYTPIELANILLRDKDFLMENQGGVTLSGGEPLAQADFVWALLNELGDLHTAIETSGYCSKKVFEQVISRIDYVMLDIKIVNPELHKKYTGVDNRTILENLACLQNSGKAFVIRVPLIPGVSDTEENLTQTALLLRGTKNLQKVELLPYHKTAGAKYGMFGMEYSPDFDTEADPNFNVSIFEAFGIPCEVL